MNEIVCYFCNSLKCECKDKLVHWTINDERKFVNNLGTEEWSVASDLKHPREWWLTKYLEVTEARQDENFIVEGRKLAERLLKNIEKQKNYR